MWAPEVITSAGADDDWLLLIAEQLQARALEERAAGPVLHDVNNVMTALLYEVHVAQERARRGADCVPALERVKAALTSAAAITRGFARLGRAGRVTEAAVDLRERVLEIRSVLDAVSGETVSLEVDIPSGLPPVTMRPDVLDRVILNLVANSAEAIPGRGQVRIRARRGAAAAPVPREDAVAGDGSCVVVIVQDDGRGMSAATVERAFAPTFTTKAEGTGIGLPLVSRVVRRAGGRVGIRSVEGEGTAVEVHLPAAAPAH